MANDEAVMEAPEQPPAHPVPIHGEVRIGGRARIVAEAADFGAYRTFVLGGTEEKQQVLPYDEHRLRAYVIVSGTGPVFIGSEAQCAAIKAGGPASAGGAQLQAGTTPIPIGHKQPVWLVPDGTHSATVVVIQERMERA